MEKAKRALDGLKAIGQDHADRGMLEKKLAALAGPSAKSTDVGARLQPPSPDRAAFVRVGRAFFASPGGAT